MSFTPPGNESIVLVPPDSRFPNLEKGAVHQKCTEQRAGGYPERHIQGAVKWSEANSLYEPAQFTHPKVEAGPGWADPADANTARLIRPGGKFESYEGAVTASGDGVTPRNPRGRTGIKGRGLLGKWGANFAADPIVTRVNPESGKLEMIAIERTDSHLWAIPGGMVDFGESLSTTLARELAEEALGKEAIPAQVKQLEEKFRDLFNTQGHEVYAGYVDDPRNTDNSWMETRAVHLHLTGQDAQIGLHAGDDAGQVQWMEVNADNLSKLYASHGDFVRKAVLDFQQSTGHCVLGDGTVR